MPRGQKSQVGEERVAPNGYRYIRMRHGWELKHRVIVENRLGRPLGDDERIRFADNDRTNLHPDNLIVYKVKAKKAEPAWIGKAPE